MPSKLMLEVRPWRFLYCAVLTGIAVAIGGWWMLPIMLLATADLK